MAVDDRKKSRSRFSLFLVLSLLAHLLLFVLMWLHPLEIEKKTKGVTVQVKLFQAPAKGGAAAQQQNTQEKTDKEKAAAKKAAKEKAEKSDKSGEAAKKQEAKGKEEPREQKPREQEPKKQEPKKEEPKKQEPKKQEAPKAKSEPKKTESSKPRRAARDEQMLDYSQYDRNLPGPNSDNTQNKKPGLPDQDPNNLDYWTKRLSNIKQINEQALQRSIVVTEGANTVMDQRSRDGMKVIQTMTREQRQEFSRVLTDNVGLIIKNYVKPKKDGKKYKGEIRFFIDAQGFIAEANFKTRSGSEALDKAMLDALLATRKLELSRDAYVNKVVAGFPILLDYSDEDME